MPWHSCKSGRITNMSEKYVTSFLPNYYKASSDKSAYNCGRTEHRQYAHAYTDTGPEILAVFPFPLICPSLSMTTFPSSNATSQRSSIRSFAIYLASAKVEPCVIVLSKLGTSTR